MNLFDTVVSLTGPLTPQDTAGLSKFCATAEGFAIRLGVSIDKQLAAVIAAAFSLAKE